MTVFNNTSINRLLDKLDYERWLLPYIVRRMRPQQATAIMDLERHQVNLTVQDSLSDAAVQSTLLQFLPLVLVATFKVLDRVVEWLLEENGNNTNYWKFTHKHGRICEQVSRGKMNLPALFRREPALLETWINLYDKLREPRNSIVHRHSFRLVGQDIEIFDKDNPSLMSFRLSSSVVIDLSDMTMTVVDLLQQPSPSQKLIHKTKYMFDTIAPDLGLTRFGVPSFTEYTPQVIVRGEAIWDDKRQTRVWRYDKADVEKEIFKSFPQAQYYLLDFVGQENGQDRLRLVIPSEDLPTVNQIEIAESDLQWQQYRQSL